MQATVEGRNFDIRKQILKFDDVLNEQRKVIFRQRLDIMKSDDTGEIVTDMRHHDTFMPPKSYADQRNSKGFHAAVIEHLNMDLPIIDWCEEEGVNDEVILERSVEASEKLMEEKAEKFGADNMRLIEKQFAAADH